jgi:Ser/Thr protein kinase RdoA (MazF antagonist)
LPIEVRNPEVVDHGTGTGFDWLVTRRSAGRVLARCWPTMSQSQQRHAVEQIAFMLRALHTTTLPGRLRSEHDDTDAPQLLDFTRERSPVAPLLAALARIATLPHVDRGVMSDLGALVETSAPTIEPFDVRTLIHGELTFENVLWDRDEITALIGFEWARPAPHDLELDALLRFCTYSFLHVAEGYEPHIRAEPYEEVPSWLAEDYPELFAAPSLRDRLRIYAIAFEVRRLLMRPPSATTRALSARDPLSHLVQLLDGRSHLDFNGVNRVLPG